MSATYEIHPKIGVARLGNSPNAFYLSPETVGGLPIRCDGHGNVVTDDNGNPELITEFKDSVGRIKRQAAKYRIFKNEGGQRTELALGRGIKGINWTVHIANKKPIWYTFSELQGDLEFGEQNSYQNQHIPVNNPTVEGEARQQLIIDPGPRSIAYPKRHVPISRYNTGDYKFASFPSPQEGGQQIDVLGDLRTDDQGNLIALGAFGNVTGDGDITSFRGGAGFWDDISDGFVLASVTLDSGEVIDAEPAWLLVGSPKFAPELVNITTLYDTIEDVALRFMKADPNIFPGCDTAAHFPSHQGYTPLNGFNPDYVVNFERDIKPIIARMQGYRWVADIPYLADFANPQFNLADPSPANKENRQAYFDMFRVPVLPQDYHKWIRKVNKGPNTIFNKDGLPLMPLNSGDNSVTNTGPIYKFETLSATQYFLMNQWAEGKFTNDPAPAVDKACQLNQASVGNCVGAPFSPGIETTWIMRNASIYSAPQTLKLAHFSGNNQDLNTYYAKNGLSTTADEAEGSGCEPGDITKRMAIPWQADFQQCTVQTPNITNPHVNQFADGTGIQVPPAFYVYWWPPQSPMHVVAGSLDPGDQIIDGWVSQIQGQPPIVPAGERVPYQRGILNVDDMIQSWSRLGFILNTGNERFPYFVEVERNNLDFGQLAASQQAARNAQVLNK